ncbi:MAG TPA: twin-arginine translocase TatA/TatE family subunit [Conexivisphaerales archaeon]|nr:twin-arginine translocase TatA/TatE family subunit [Conexivisphaerales archaeon]
MLFTPLLLQGSEWLIVIVIIVVLIFGAGKIPDLARSLGRAQGEFQKGKVESDLEVQKMKEAAGQSTAQPSDHDRLLKAAKELGISTEGKTDDQIREEIKAHIA